MALMVMCIPCKSPHRLMHDAEHEQNEAIGFPFRRGKADRTVIFFLIVLDDALYGNPLKNRLPTCKQRRLPKPARPAVPVCKRMDEFKFVMKYARTDEHVRFARFQPIKELFRQVVYHIIRRRDMNDLSPFIDNADRAGTPLSGFFHQPPHHQAVRPL